MLPLPSREGEHRSKHPVFHDDPDDRYTVRHIGPRREHVRANEIADLIKTRGAEIESSSWVAEAEGRVIGSISMLDSREAGMGRLEQFHVSSEWQADRRLARRLVRAAADYARELGLLKLVIEVPEDLPGLPNSAALTHESRAAEAECRVQVYFETLGFVFSRRRQEDETVTLEFYLDLYHPPLIETTVHESG